MLSQEEKKEIMTEQPKQPEQIEHSEQLGQLEQPEQPEQIEHSEQLGQLEQPEQPEQIEHSEQLEYYRLCIFLMNNDQFDSWNITHKKTVIKSVNVDENIIAKCEITCYNVNTLASDKSVRWKWSGDCIFYVCSSDDLIHRPLSSLTRFHQQLDRMKIPLIHRLSNKPYLVLHGYPEGSACAGNRNIEKCEYPPILEAAVTEDVKLDTILCEYCRMKRKKAQKSTLNQYFPNFLIGCSPFVQNSHQQRHYMRDSDSSERYV